MVSKKVPKRLWYYGLVHQDVILSSIYHEEIGRTGIEEVTGQTPDISELIDFDLYDSLWFIYKKQLLKTDDNIILGKWYGISQKIGSENCNRKLTVLEKVVARTTVQHVICTELIDTDMKCRI